MSLKDLQHSAESSDHPSRSLHLGRYDTLRKAIDAPEDADLSHLSVGKPKWLNLVPKKCWNLWISPY